MTYHLRENKSMVKLLDRLFFSSYLKEDIESIIGATHLFLPYQLRNKNSLMSPFLATIQIAI